MAMSEWTAFDLETISVPSAAEYLEPVSAPSNYKDPVKIAAYIEEGTAKALRDAALDIDLARVVAIGMQIEGESEPSAYYIEDERQERLMLQNFWAGFTPTTRLVGFRIRTYDIPLLVRRSQLLGIAYPDINLDRYRSTQVIDLYDRLTFNGAVDGKKLDTYCKLFGIEVEDGITGKDVAACVAAGDFAAVVKHALADVDQVVQLASKLGVIRPALTEVA